MIITNRDGSCTLVDDDNPARTSTVPAGLSGADRDSRIIAFFPPAPSADRVPVPKYVIVDRLQAAGKLGAARAALDAADLYTRERWNTRDAIYADDAAALALLASIGADPADILAPA